jgi:Tol biopolymer transport system component
MRWFSAMLVVAAFAALAVVVSARPAGDAHPGRNGLIAFSGNWEISTMRSDGSGLRRLTRNNLEERCPCRLTTGILTETSPACSPDGRKLVFSRDGQIYTMNADGTGIRRLTRARRGAGEPDWAPGSR